MWSYNTLFFFIRTQANQLLLLEKPVGTHHSQTHSQIPWVFCILAIINSLPETKKNGYKFGGNVILSINLMITKHYCSNGEVIRLAALYTDAVDNYCNILKDVVMCNSLANHRNSFDH